VPAGNATITDVASPALQVTGCSAPAGCQVQGGVATAALGTLAGAASQSATVSATVSCAVADGTVIASQGTASFDGTDPTPADDSAAATIVAVNPAAAISGAAVSNAVLWPPNNKMVPITVSYNVTDNCPGTACTLSVTSSEQSSTTDWQIIDDHH